MILLVAGLAGARGALPDVITLAPDSVASDRANLNGATEANGEATRAFFQWGRTTNYELTVTGPGWDLGVGWTGVVSMTVTGLAPATLHHYRLVATNYSGTVFGSNMSFSTATAAPPTATTGTATNVGAYAAVLAGTVNSQSLPTTAYFQWGPTTNYGTTTPPQSLPPLGAKTPVQQYITNLLVAHTYHYRVIASNSLGLAVGGDSVFTTLQYVQPTAATAAASGLNTNRATLNGSINPGGLAAVGAFQWGLTTNYGNTAPPAAVGNGTGYVPITAVVSNLLPGTLYHFRTVATNASSAFSLGMDYTFTTPLYLPPIAATLTATNLATNGATLAGLVNPNGPSAVAWFEWGGTPGYGQRTAAQAIGNGLADIPVGHAISGLAPGATYHFRQVATNAAGTVYGSNQTFTALLGPPIVATTPPTVLPALPPSLTMPYAYLKGAVMPNNDETRVWFEWGTSPAYGNILETPDLPAGPSNVAVSAFLYPLTLDATYHFRIVASNRAGISHGGDLSFTRYPATGPQLAMRRLNLASNAVSFTAQAGRSYVLLKTLDLQFWQPVQTNAATTSRLEFPLPATGPPSVYRVLAQ